MVASGPAGPAPRAMVALQRLCAPAVWAAAALLICALRTSGRTQRLCALAEAQGLRVRPLLRGWALGRPAGAPVPELGAPANVPRSAAPGCFQESGLWGRLFPEAGRAALAGLRAVSLKTAGPGPPDVSEVLRTWTRPSSPRLPFLGSRPPGPRSALKSPSLPTPTTPARGARRGRVRPRKGIRDPPPLG